jgi:hypothetical protein
VPRLARRGVGKTIEERALVLCLDPGQPGKI